MASESMNDKGKIQASINDWQGVDMASESMNDKRKIFIEPQNQQMVWREFCVVSGNSV
jgi:guanylate kinase